MPIWVAGGGGSDQSRTQHVVYKALPAAWVCLGLGLSFWVGRPESGCQDHEGRLHRPIDPSFPSPAVISSWLLILAFHLSHCRVTERHGAASDGMI